MREKNLNHKILILLSLIILTANTSKGQQVSFFNHYFYNATFYNPAFTGNKETTNIMLISRNQWAGFDNSPKLNILSVDGSILNNKMGIGASLFSDTKGINKTLGGNLLYSYRIKLNEKSKLRFGVSLQFISHSLNFSDAVVENVSDPTFYSSEQSNTSFNGNLGLAYFINDLEVGLALNQVLQSKNSFSNQIENDISYSPAQHYIGSLKYTFTLNQEKNIRLAPQALIRYVANAPIQYELNTNLHLNKFWVGASYKKKYAISANAGVTLLKKLDIGYSYDFITSDIGQYSGISHELMVNFKFGKRKPKEKIEDPVIEEPPVVEEPTKEDTIPKEETTDEGIRIITAPASEFVNPQSKTPQTGAYVVVGTFTYRDYAEGYAQKIKNLGYPDASLVYSDKDKYNYVYMFKANNKQDAIKKIEEAKEKGSREAWILILTD